jgi:nucleoside-diphosphate-sugar epimerase
MRVLVTGGSGFIGKAVARELERRGEPRPISFDSPLDVRDALQVSNNLTGVDAVIHLAGRLGTSETFGVEYETADVNVLGALTVADQCQRRGIPMVWIGTGHYGQPNPYAITKACAQDLLLARGNVAVVKAYHAYGPRQKSYPPHGKGHVRKIIPSFVNRALTGMDIEIHGDGSNVIDLVHVDEVARVLVDALTGPTGVVLEAGTGVPMTVREVAEEVKRLTGSWSQIVHLPMRPGEPEGAVVVAREPLCAAKPFPYGMDETIAHYAQALDLAAV